MKTRLLVLAIVAAAGIAPRGHALSSELVEWGRGPVQFLMTRDEAAKWKTITTDDEARVFVALFWTRRDPTPATPRNEFREEYEARVAYADEKLGDPRGDRRGRGAMTDRGRALIVFGPPKTILRSRGQNSATLAESDERGGTVTESWVYEDGAAVQDIFRMPRAQIRFTDRFGNGDYKLERSTLDVEAAQQRAVTLGISQPELTEAVFLATPAPPAPVLPAELTTESLRNAVNELKGAAKNPYEKKAYATWGQYATATGEAFVPVMLYFPKSAGVTGENLTFFGVLQDESGKSVAAFEEPVKLSSSRDDFYVDRSLRGVAAGKYRGFFGVARDGKPLAMATSDLELSASTDATAPAASPLILSNNVYPLTEVQAPDAPFTFGGVKVVPKADRTFRKSDELWYFVELVHPGLAELPGGSVAPKVQVRIDVEGPKKMIEPPRVVEATPMKGVPGHYGVGSAIPLSTFPAGEYRFTVKVIDTVRKTSWTRSESFRVAE